MSRYKVLSRNRDSVTVEATANTSTHGLLNEMVYDDIIQQWVADDIMSKQESMDVRAMDTLTFQMNGSGPLPSQQRDERKEKAMAKRVMDTLVKQYAPDTDTAWDWMRKGHELGWEWNLHSFNGVSVKDPLGQRGSKTMAPAFSNGAGVFVGICIVAGRVCWAWFREEEWGAPGRELVLSGNRNHFPDPVAAITDYSLLGEGAPREKDSLNDVFGGWDD